MMAMDFGEKTGSNFFRTLVNASNLYAPVKCAQILSRYTFNFDFY